MKRKTTKDKILHIIKKDHEISMKGLMQYFSISEVAVRKHLRELIRLGIIQERIVKKEIGRPFHLYSLTSKGHETFPNRYDDLPAELLQDLEKSQGKEAVRKLLQTRKAREKKELEQTLQTTAFDERIERLIELQEEKGYMIEMKTMDDGNIEMKNFNCPIYNLASKYKIVCSNEKDMYKELFPNSDVISKECMTTGGKYCCWMITKPKTKES